MSAIISFLSSTVSSALYRPVDGDDDRPQHQFPPANSSALDREMWIRDVASEIDHDDVAAALDDLDATLERCRASLGAFEKKERFVGVRLDRYGRLMDRREERMRLLQRQQEQTSPARSCSASQEDERALVDEKGDLENTNTHANAREQLESLQTKHVEDETALRGVRDLHRDLIAEIETLKRRIRELEEKREDILEKREECQAFLAAASEGA